MSKNSSARTSGHGVIVVTGAAGFIGSAVMGRAAALGRQTLALVRHSEVGQLAVGAAHLVIDWTDFGSLREALASSSPELIVHCAGASARSGEPVAELYGANVALAATLLDAVRRVCRDVPVTLLSSAAVYGPDAPCPTPESAPLDPRSHYAVSKVLMEEMARSFFRFDGLAVKVARPFNVLGPGEPVGSVVSELREQMMAVADGKTARVLLREVVSVRDFVDVEDVADGLLLIADSGTPGEAFNVCSGHGVTVRELAEAAARAWNRTASLSVSGGEPATTVSIGTPARLSALGWTPQYSLEESLTRIAAGRFDWSHAGRQPRGG